MTFIIELAVVALCLLFIPSSWGIILKIVVMLAALLVVFTIIPYHVGGR